MWVSHVLRSSPNRVVVVEVSDAEQCMIILLLGEEGEGGVVTGGGMDERKLGNGNPTSKLNFLFQITFHADHPRVSFPGSWRLTQMETPTPTTTTTPTPLQALFISCSRAQSHRILTGSSFILATSFHSQHLALLYLEASHLRHDGPVPPAAFISVTSRAPSPHGRKLCPTEPSWTEAVYYTFDWMQGLVLAMAAGIFPSVTRRLKTGSMTGNLTERGCGRKKMKNGDDGGYR